jgi:hypothetical protein
MAELNVSAFAYLYGAGQPEVVTAMLTVMVSNENARPPPASPRSTFTCRCCR